MTLTIYRDKQRQFRWHLKASNGRKLANGGEAYKRHRDLRGALARVFKGWKYLGLRDHMANPDGKVVKVIDNSRKK